MRPLSFVVIAVSLMLTGCARKEEAVPASVPTPVAVIMPLPRIAEDRPAPANTLSLDPAETAQADKPNDPKINLALGYSYYKIKAYADAARAFDKAARLAPNDPKPLLYLGYTQMAIGALDNAVTTFTAVAALPKITPDVKSEAFLQLGTIKGAFNDLDAAMDFYEKSLKANPKQGAAMLALGARAAELHRTEEATKRFTAAAAILPDGRPKAAALAALGALAEGKGKKSDALALYKKAAALDDENPFAANGVKRLGLRN